VRRDGHTFDGPGRRDSSARVTIAAGSLTPVKSTAIMSRTPAPYLLRVVLPLFLVATLSCGGGPQGAATSTSPTGPSPSTSIIEPADADWELLGAQLAALAIDALQTALAGNSPPTVSALRFEKLLLDIPPFGLAYTTSYSCCGIQPPTSSFVSNSLQTQIVDARGVIGYGSTYSIDGNGSWRLPDRGTTWGIQIATGGLQMSSNLITVGGTVAPAQEFHLLGSLLSTADPCALTLLAPCPVHKSGPD
jgi:hypothetical protein